MKRAFGAFQGPLIILIAAVMATGEAFAAETVDAAAAVENSPIAQLRRDATQGNVTAEYVLGCCYNGDRGFERNPAEAAKWWRRAAEKGVADAQYCLGLSYYLGQGSPGIRPRPRNGGPRRRTRSTRTPSTSSGSATTRG